MSKATCHFWLHKRRNRDITICDCLIIPLSEHSSGYHCCAYVRYPAVSPDMRPPRTALGPRSEFHPNLRRPCGSTSLERQTGNDVYHRLHTVHTLVSKAATAAGYTSIPLDASPSHGFAMLIPDLPRGSCRLKEQIACCAELSSAICTTSCLLQTLKPSARPVREESSAMVLDVQQQG